MQERDIGKVLTCIWICKVWIVAAREKPVLETCFPDWTIGIFVLTCSVRVPKYLHWLADVSQSSCCCSNICVPVMLNLVLKVCSCSFLLCFCIMLSWFLLPTCSELKPSIAHREIQKMHMKGLIKKKKSSAWGRRIWASFNKNVSLKIVPTILKKIPIQGIFPKIYPSKVNSFQRNFFFSCLC